MWLLLSGGNRAEAMRHPWIGRLISPRAQHFPFPDRPWAIDNEAYSAWNPPAYALLLRRWRFTPGCWWAAVPDVVTDHAATLARWHLWAPYVRGLGYPLAFVAQDGATPDTIPWGEMAALFVGGSTEWKLGAEARSCVAAAQARGLRTHIGRCNTDQRTAYAVSLGIDSIDGTGWSRFLNEKVQQAGQYFAMRYMFAGDN